MIKVIDGLTPYLTKMEDVLVEESINKRVFVPAAEEILERSVELVPVKSGRLQRSGRVERDQGGVSVVFGGSRASYAGAVHERKPWLADATEVVGVEAVARKIDEALKF